MRAMAIALDSAGYLVTGAPAIAASEVERLSPVVLLAAHVRRSEGAYNGRRPNERNIGPPPIDANLASVEGAVRYPCSVRKAAASRRVRRRLVGFWNAPSDSAEPRLLTIS